MKLDKKGFMMAEVVVVSAIILIFLASIYVSYNQLYSKYKSRVIYYDAVTLYRLAYYRDNLIENHVISSLLDNVKNSDSKFQKIDDFGTSDNVFIIYNNRKNLNGNELNNVDGIHPTYKDFISFLSSSVDFTNTDYVMVMEKCNNDDDCKYAYLEVYDGGDVTNSTPSTPSTSSNNNNDTPTVTTGGECHIYDAEVFNSCTNKLIKVRDCVGTLSQSYANCTYSIWSFKAICKATCYYDCNGVQKSVSKSQNMVTNYCN